MILIKLTCRDDDEAVHHLNDQHDHKIMMIESLNSLTENFFSINN